MAIAITLQEYLQKNDIHYDVLPHVYTHTSLGTARAANVPQSQLAKPVILKDDKGYLMAIIPATHQVKLGALSRQMKRRLGLATEPELESLFSDCDRGAIPPVGEAYKMDMIVDDSLDACSDVYFEAGDHIDLIHVQHDQFSQLMQHAEHSSFSDAMWRR